MPTLASLPPPRRPRDRSRRAAAALALFAAVSTAAPGAAAQPAPSPGRTAAARAGADRAAVEAARRFLCPHGGAPRRGGRCRGGAAVASAGARDGEGSARGWDAGLPAVTRRQAPCPDGTVRARVLLWEDAVRCVPR